MKFTSALWHPVAIAASALNLVGAGFAVGLAEPAHAAVHVGVAGAFAWWARRLRSGAGSASTAEIDARSRLELLEDEMLEQRRQLAEAQERIDFTERLLAQAAESRTPLGK